MQLVQVYPRSPLAGDRARRLDNNCRRQLPARITFNASIDAMIPEDDPVLAELAAVVDGDFGTQDLFLVRFRRRMCSALHVEKISDLAAELEALPGVTEVQSPLNAQRVESGFWGIEIAPMTSELPEPEAIAEFKTAIRQPVRRAPGYADGRGQLCSWS